MPGPLHDQAMLDTALAELQATASNFAYSCIRDARARAEYLRDIGRVSAEYREAVFAKRMTARQAAEQVQELRNHLMDLARMRSSAIGKAYAQRLKQQGRTMAELTEKYAVKLFGRAFGELDEAKQAAVYVEIVESAGRADPKVVALARKVGKVGQRLFLVSLAVAAYEIYEAEDKPREVARQGVLAGAGVAGGAAAGAAAVGAGVCAATAPVCVGLAALVGGVLFAFGADIAFDSIYPKPAGR